MTQKLTEAEHAALEALDVIAVRLRRLPFAWVGPERDALEAAITQTEAAMRAAPNEPKIPAVPESKAG